MKKIVHFTSVHTRKDVRIFFKECQSLAKAGYQVFLVVADGLGNERVNGIEIIDIGLHRGRFKRSILTVNKMYQVILTLNADIYHFHDPELLRIGKKLIKRNKKVIYDVHEDVEKDILSKHYIPKCLRRPLANIFKKYELSCVKKFTGVITATPYIRDKFLPYQSKIVDINNYPILEELFNQNFQVRKKQFCYAGVISDERGEQEMRAAISLCEGYSLALAGPKNQLCKDNDKISYLGFLNREQIKTLYNESIAGLVVLHPIINYLDALPVKMFEYMSAGIPVIASNFPLWQEIINDAACGICVDPLNPEAIAEAMQYIIDHPDQAVIMGRNGRSAVEIKYNWGNEAKKLILLYNKVLFNN